MFFKPKNVFLHLLFIETNKNQQSRTVTVLAVAFQLAKTRLNKLTVAKIKLRLNISMVQMQLI